MSCLCKLLDTILFFSTVVIYHTLSEGSPNKALQQKINPTIKKYPGIALAKKYRSCNKHLKNTISALAAYRLHSPPFPASPHATFFLHLPPPPLSTPFPPPLSTQARCGGSARAGREGRGVVGGRAGPGGRGWGRRHGSSLRGAAGSLPAFGRGFVTGFPSECVCSANWKMIGRFHLSVTRSTRLHLENSHLHT